MDENKPVADVTVMLDRLNRGETAAMSELLPAVYDELRRQAKYQMSRERGSHTLQATALVHEAFVKLAGRTPDVQWEGSRHFYNAAAEAMWRVLVDHARKRSAEKRGGEKKRQDLDDVDVPIELEGTNWEDLDRALNDLKQEDERRHQVVMYRFFAGLSEEQTAALMNVSEKTIQRDWKTARMYLLSKLAQQ
jgi:RNA polymerase sigma factor (TIGR02999 family)